MPHANRRSFLAGGLVCLTIAGLPGLSIAAPTAKPKSATAITEVFGHGERLIGVAVEFEQILTSDSLNLSDYQVSG